VSFTNVCTRCLTRLCRRDVRLVHPSSVSQNRGAEQIRRSATMSGVPSVLAGLDQTMPGDVGAGKGYLKIGKLTVFCRSLSTLAQLT
jgi:hypothetical protein